MIRNDARRLGSRLAFALYLSLMGCASFIGGHLPATPLAPGRGELMAAASGTAIPPASGVDAPLSLEGSISLRGRYGLQRGDIGGAFVAETRCFYSDPSSGQCTRADGYRVELVGTTWNWQNRFFSLSQRMGLMAGLWTTEYGQVPDLGAAFWLIFGYRPTRELELYLSGRGSFLPGLTLGARWRFSRMMLSAEIGYSRLLWGFSSYRDLDQFNLSLAFGYASDYARRPPVRAAPQRLTFAAATPPGPELRADRHYTLPNGLEVILQQDRRSPFVAVHLWYHVGQRDAPSGQPDLPHLVEHLMFEGSSHADSGDLQGRGALAMNATTLFDRTEYFQIAASANLETALWMESDRMGFLVEALGEEKLERAKSAVKNEYREKIDTEPYGHALIELVNRLFPEPHPFHADRSDNAVDRLTLGDAKRFLNTWYTPSNATLVLVGDFELDRVDQLVARYFGSLPSRFRATRRPLPPAHLEAPIAVTHRDSLAGLPAVVVGWHSPAFLTADDAVSDVLAEVLAGTSAARLNRRLEIDERLASAADATQISTKEQSFFQIAVIGREGVEPARLLEAIDATLEEIRGGGLTQAEVTASCARLERARLAQMDSTLGLTARADLLALYSYGLGDPNGLSTDLARYRGVTAEQVSRFARDVLDPRRRVVVEVAPAEGGDR